MHFRKMWVSRLLAVAMGFAVAFVVAEILLRAFGLPHFYKAHSAPHQFHFIKDRATGEDLYVNAPSSTITFQYGSNPRGYFKPGNIVEHVTNAWGFRGGDFSEPVPPRTLRLLFVGDSFTFGEGVNFEDTFSEVTPALLAPRLSQENVQVRSYNIGVGGYNTAQELFLLKSIAPQLRPNAVILCYVLNDAEPPLFEIDPNRGPVRRRRGAAVPEGLNDPSPPSTLLYHSRVAQLVWRYEQGRERSRATEAYYLSLYNPESEGWKETRGALREMGAFCRRENVPLVVMIFPVLYKLDAHYPFRNIHNLVAKEAQDDGAVVLDLLPSFQGRRATDLWVYPTDQHPNEKAHRIAAEALAAKLTATPAFLEKIANAAQSSSIP